MISPHLAAVIAVTLLLTGCAATPTISEHASTTPSTETKPCVLNPELRAQLLDLKARDQEARSALIDAMQTAERVGGAIRFDENGANAIKAMNAIDTESTAFLEQMIEKHGWPTFDMVGEDGANAAWLLAQHADATPELQQRVLDLMEPLVDRAQANGRFFAMLTDRVLTGKGEAQVYATQFADDEHGVLRPMPTADWETVDERRAAVGLAPITQYAASLSETYGQPTSTTPLETDPNRAAREPEPEPHAED